MKKVLFSFLLVFTMLISSGFANAQEPVKTDVATTNQKLDSLTTSNLSNSEKETEFKQIMSNASDSAKQAFLDSVATNLKEKVSGTEIGAGEKTIDVGSGITVQLVSNEPVTQNTNSSSATQTSSVLSPNVISGLGYSDGFAGNKDYGDRKFTCSVYVKSYGVTIGTLRLGNHFSVGSYGLKMRYASITGTSGAAGLVDIHSASAHITDSVATHNDSNMNTHGNYSWTLGIAGYGSTYYSEIKAHIDLLELHKSGKYAKVFEDYEFDL